MLQAHQFPIQFPFIYKYSIIGWHYSDFHTKFRLMIFYLPHWNSFRYAQEIQNQNYINLNIIIIKIRSGFFFTRNTHIHVWYIIMSIQTRLIKESLISIAWQQAREIDHSNVGEYLWYFSYFSMKKKLRLSYVFATASSNCLNVFFQ